MLASWRPLLIAAFMLAPAPAAAQFVQHAALVPDELRELESLLRDLGFDPGSVDGRSEEHTSELQSLMRISYAVFCLKKINLINNNLNPNTRYLTLSRTTLFIIHTNT